MIEAWFDGSYRDGLAGAGCVIQTASQRRYWRSQVDARSGLDAEREALLMTLRALASATGQSAVVYGDCIYLSGLMTLPSVRGLMGALPYPVTFERINRRLNKAAHNLARQALEEAASGVPRTQPIF